MFDVVGVLRNTIKDVIFYLLWIGKDVKNDGGYIKKHVNACQEACMDTKKKWRDINMDAKCFREK